MRIVHPELCITESEYKSRQDTLKGKLRSLGLDSMLLLNNRYVTYLTGLDCSPTERPIGLLLPVDGEPAIVTAKLEEAHIRHRLPWVSNVHLYLDYPGDPYCFQTVVRLLEEHGLRSGRIGCDELRTNFVSANLSHYLEKALPEASFVRSESILVEMMEIKSEAEKRLVREAARWGANTHRILQQLIEPGRAPYDVGAEATLEGSLVMLRFFGEDYEPYRTVGSPTVGGPCGPTYADFEAGPGTAFPHGSQNVESSRYHRKIREGDNIVTAAEANVGGYYCELERTMFVGKPSEKQAKYFQIMLEAQTAALEQFRPGRKTRDVDLAARAVFQKHGVMDYVLHHSGHGRGYRVHEPPFCDIGDHTILRPGMQFSCEPGIYVPNVGGFRHSDDVFVTQDEPEINSYYPRDLESLIIDIKR